MKTLIILYLLSVLYLKMALSQSQSTCEQDVKLEGLIKQLSPNGQKTTRNIMYKIETTLLTRVFEEFCPTTITKYGRFFQSIDKNELKEMAILTGCTAAAGLPLNKAFDITFCQRMSRLDGLVKKMKQDRQQTLVNILNDWNEFIVKSFPDMPDQIKNELTSQLKNEDKNVVNSIIEITYNK